MSASWTKLNRLDRPEWKALSRHSNKTQRTSASRFHGASHIEWQLPGTAPKSLNDRDEGANLPSPRNELAVRFGPISLKNSELERPRSGWPVFFGISRVCCGPGVGARGIARRSLGGHHDGFGGLCYLMPLRSASRSEAWMVVCVRFLGTKILAVLGGDEAIL